MNWRTHARTHTHTHTHTCAHAHTRTHTYMRTCTHTHTHTRTHTTHTRTQVHAHNLIHTCKHTRNYTWLCACIFLLVDLNLSRHVTIKVPQQNVSPVWYSCSELVHKRRREIIRAVANIFALGENMGVHVHCITLFTSSDQNKRGNELSEKMKF